MPRYSAPSDVYRPSDNNRPRPTNPQNDRPTFPISSRHQSHDTSRQDANTPRQNAYTPSRQQAYTPAGQGAYTSSRHDAKPPSARNQNQTQNSYRLNTRPHPRARGRNRDTDQRSHILDDQIAPTATSHDIASLQRWAHATSSIPAHPPRKNELGTVERIEARYGAGVTPRYVGGFDGIGREERVERKRERDVELEEGVDGDGEKKRRKILGDEVIDLTGENEDESEVDYAQSSEWSWPGDGA